MLSSGNWLWFISVFFCVVYYVFAITIDNTIFQIKYTPLSLHGTSLSRLCSINNLGRSRCKEMVITWRQAHYQAEQK